MPPLTAKYSKKERKAIKDASEARAKEKRAAATTMPAASDAKNVEQGVKDIIEAFEKMFITPRPVLQSCKNDERLNPPRNNLGCRKPTDPAGLRWDPLYESTFILHDIHGNEVRRA